jgi:DNA-binding NarL/FixJ family response regulator
VTACLRVVDERHVLIWPLRGGSDASCSDGPADGPAADGGAGGAYFRSSAIARAASGLFEVLWSGPSVASPTVVRPVELTAAQWRILRLMAAGMSDGALAAAADSTVKTVRSHIAAILLVLGVPTRFAAGVEAARRGWL